MRDYELAFIIGPNIDSEGVTGVVEQVSELVKSGNGQVASVDVWGRRKLAYPIKNYFEGTYVLLKAQMSPDQLGDLERNLKLSEQIIRYMLLNDE